jgi:large subunit ribosomal protein L3
MLNTLLGSKGQMSQTFVQGTRVPVSFIKLGPCVVTHIKKMDKDGYWAVQLGFGSKRIKNLKRPLQGHLRGVTKDLSAQAGKKAPRFLREVRLEKKPEVKVGDVINVSDIFEKGDLVSVTARSKGKGFAGVVKRWGFAGGPRTHGQSDRLRAPGSIGQGTTPGRVHKGKKMAGRMGGGNVTIKNLVVVSVDPEKNEVGLSGPVPGTYKTLLVVRKLASGKLDQLIKTAPVAQIKEGEPEEESEEEGVKEAKQQMSETQEKDVKAVPKSEDSEKGK